MLCCFHVYTRSAAINAWVPAFVLSALFSPAVAAAAPISPAPPAAVHASPDGDAVVVTVVTAVAEPSLASVPSAAAAAAAAASAVAAAAAADSTAAPNNGDTAMWDRVSGHDPGLRLRRGLRGAGVRGSGGNDAKLAPRCSHRLRFQNKRAMISIIIFRLVARSSRGG